MHNYQFDQGLFNFVPIVSCDHKEKKIKFQPVCFLTTTQWAFLVVFITEQSFQYNLTCIL